MEQGLKQRLIGAAVLVILAVIFIPMFLDTGRDEEEGMVGTNIPEQPADMPAAPAEDFSSRIVPLQQSMEQAPAEMTPAEQPPMGATGATAPPAEGPPPSDAAAAVHKTPETVVENVENSVGVAAWVVQLGSFASRENAQALNEKLRRAGFRAFVEPLQQNTGTIYRVRIGPELKRSDADAINDRLKKDLQIEGIVVHYP